MEVVGSGQEKEGEHRRDAKHRIGHAPEEHRERLSADQVEAGADRVANRKGRHGSPLSASLGGPYAIIILGQ